MSRLILTWDDISAIAKTEAQGHTRLDLKLYGVPRGGIYAAMAMLPFLKGSRLVMDPSQADLIVDDILDSGATRDRFASYGKPFVVLVNKQDPETPKNLWVTFPWEVANGELGGVEDNVRRILQYIGEDPNREGLRDTPRRVTKSYQELFAGYKQNAADLITTFEDGTCDEMVLLKNIEFISYCEHHMLPFRGKAHVAYIPNGRVIGVSKLARLLDMYCARLQIQERIGQQVTQALTQHLQPLGSACILEAHHQCMSCRGVRKHQSIMVTSSLTGVFRTDAPARQELLSLVKD